MHTMIGARVNVNIETDDFSYSGPGVILGFDATTCLYSVYLVTYTGKRSTRWVASYDFAS